MAPTTAGKTSIRPLARAERREPVRVSRVMSRAYGTIRLRSQTGALRNAKEMRDMAETTAMWLQGEPLQGSHEPPVSAQPADGKCADRRPGGAGSRLHPLPAHPRALCLTSEFPDRGRSELLYLPD